jgi:predicted nucleic-acid-binding protein
MRSRSKGHPVVRDALYLFRTSKADFADCRIGLSNGCERTATLNRDSPSTSSS